MGWVDLGLPGKLITNKYWNPPTHVSKCKKSNPTSSIGADDVILFWGAWGSLTGLINK